MAHRCKAISVLASIRAAYPEGVIPGSDYVALLAVLRQHLNLDDVVGVASELIIRGTNPLMGTELRTAVSSLTSQITAAADVERMARRLHTEAWSSFTDGLFGSRAPAPGLGAATPGVPQTSPVPTLHADDH